MAGETLVTFDSAQVLRTAREVLAHLLNHPTVGKVLKEKGKRGGFLCVAKDGVGVHIVGAQIGGCVQEKLGTYAQYCMEKATRLLRHPKHWMSRQSEDESRNMFRGAIRTPDGTILSFSGLPGDLDELFMLVLAHSLKLMTRKQFVDRLTDFPNKYLPIITDNTLLL